LFEFDKKKFIYTRLNIVHLS